MKLRIRWKNGVRISLTWDEEWNHTSLSLTWNEFNQDWALLSFALFWGDIKKDYIDISLVRIALGYLVFDVDLYLELEDD